MEAFNQYVYNLRSSGLRSTKQRLMISKLLFGQKTTFHFTIEHLSELIEKNAVCLFMKGTPDVPQCGFSLAVSNVLKHLGVNFKGVNVLEDNDIREGIKIFSDWPTIPQLYIKKEFIGGCDIVKEMFEKKELQAKLSEKKIPYKN